jgi:hypothetical protein
MIIETAVVFLNIIMLPFQIGMKMCFCEVGTVFLHIAVMALEGLASM